MNKDYILLEFKLAKDQDKDCHFKYMLFKTGNSNRSKLYVGITHTNIIYNNVTLMYSISDLLKESTLISKKEYTREELLIIHPEWFFN